MSPLSPLAVLFDPGNGIEIPLPGELNRLYGRLTLPDAGARARVIGNFVMSLDGVVSLGVPGTTDGDEISGSDVHDSMVMGLLRSVSDAVIIGAGTLLKSPGHIWTPGFVYPPLDSEYGELRARLGKPGWAACAIVTSRGEIDTDLPVFSGGKAPVLIITTQEGETRIRKRRIPAGVRVVAAGKTGSLSVRGILGAVATALPGSDAFLVEGGPRLIGQFVDRGELDELFLTLSPRLAGRDSGGERLGLISGVRFLPGRVVAGRLNGIRKNETHLFLRYSFPPAHLAGTDVAPAK